MKKTEATIRKIFSYNDNKLTPILSFYTIICTISIIRRRQLKNLVHHFVDETETPSCYGKGQTFNQISSTSS